jgi:hypothetical protein
VIHNKKHTKLNGLELPETAGSAGLTSDRVVSASTFALCRWPVPGGRPSLRGRFSGATVLLLPFGRPEPGFRFARVCNPFSRGVGMAAAAAGWLELAVREVVACRPCTLGTN